MPKNHKKFRRLNILIVSLFFMTCILFILTFGSASVTNQFASELEAVKELEKKGLIDNLPETISPMLKNDLQFLDGYYPGLKGSAAFEKYIAFGEESFQKLFFTFIVSACLFFFSVLARIFFCIKKGPESS